jgi:uncharacterized protein YvpB
LKRKIIFIALFVCLTFSTSVAFAAPRDIQRHWSGTVVNTLLERGVIKGYLDGSFHPDRSITREEVSVLLASFIQQTSLDTEIEGIEESAENTENVESTESEEPIPVQLLEFVDINKSRWSFEAVNFLVEKQILSGYPDGTFRPKGTLTREEFATMIYNYKNDGEILKQDICFSDISDSYAFEYIRTLYQQGILSGYPDGTFRPQNTITRGEVAAVLFTLSGWDAIPPVVEIPEKLVLEVPYISQLYPVYAVVGCEGTSLLMGLHSKGYALDVGLRKFLDAMPKHTSNPAKGFVGSPYKADKTKQTRTTIFPAKLAEYGRVYGNVTDISGSSPKELQAEVCMGNPVVVYVTMWWEKPYYRNYIIEGNKQTLLSNNHVVLLCGYDFKNGSYYIADPYNNKDLNHEYKYWIDAATFERLYNERRHAAVIR